MIRLLLIEDQPSVRAGLRLLLAGEPDLILIAEAADGAAAVTLAEQLRPDVALMDVEMPRMDGIAATSALRERLPGCAVVILSLYDDTATRQRARDAGARAFIGKHDSPDKLLAVIRQVASGGL